MLFMSTKNNAQKVFSKTKIITNLKNQKKN